MSVETPTHSHLISLTGLVTSIVRAKTSLLSFVLIDIDS